jgi:hypothetical protein
MRRGFRRREVLLGSGAVRGYQPSEWQDALVLVRAGVLELEALDGGRIRFPAGAVLHLSGLPLRRLRNGGVGPLAVVVISRRGTDSFPAERASHDRRPVATQGREYG